MPENKAKTACERCGTCCSKGGPALHYEDITLLQEGPLTPEHLISIRKGEPVFSTGAAEPVAAQSEIVKIKGRGVEWTCLFLQKEGAGCAVYEQRPLECSLLQCWDTTALKEVAGRNLLSRYDIIAPHDPVAPYMRDHDTACSLENLTRLLDAVLKKDSREETLADLTNLVNTDLTIRSQAFSRFHFSLALELFYFGRPLFKILQQYGIKTHERKGKCTLSITHSFSAATSGSP